MALFALTNAQLKFAKWAVRAVGQAVPLSVAWLESQLLDNPEALTDLEWRRAVIRCTRATPAGTSEDVAQFKLDLLNVTAGDPDPTWTSGDYTICNGAIQTMVSTLVAQTDPALTFSQVRYYRMKFNPIPDVSRPFADTGPPLSVYTITSGQGTSSSTAHTPYQVATTATFRTAWAKHWGRIYLPCPALGNLGTQGRWGFAYQQLVADAVHDCLETMNGSDFFAVVPVGQLEKQPFHALLGVSAVIVDDIPDVQRRRRPRQVVNRALGV